MAATHNDSSAPHCGELEGGDFYRESVEYFGDPEMHLASSTPQEWVYMTRLQSFLMNENHFLIAMVDRKLTDESSKKRRLSDLPFHVLQTRNLLDYEKYLWLPVHPHTTNYSSPFSRSVVFRTSSTPEYSVYSSPRFPNIHLSLLHKRNQENEYTARGTLGTALETFQCLIQIGAPQNQIRTWTESVATEQPQMARPVVFRTPLTR